MTKLTLSENYSCFDTTSRTEPFGSARNMTWIVYSVISSLKCTSVYEQCGSDRVGRKLMELDHDKAVDFYI